MGRVLIACEFSGIVREAFTKLGHDAYSCDLIDTELPSSKHLKCDVREVLNDGWDLMIAHPPCTYLAGSGAAWFKYRQKEQEEALEFVQLLLNAPINRIALENPVGVISTKIRKPDQIIQPYQFGHLEKKRTCLWFKNLPKLNPISDLKKEVELLPKTQQQRLYYLPESKGRARLRSITYTGIANAMAEQWGELIK